MGIRQAQQLAARLRREAPYAAEYDISGGRITGRVDKLKLVSSTELRSVDSAAFGSDVALLHGGRFPRYVKRIVWLPQEPVARQRLRAALAAAGIPVSDLPAAAPAPPA